MAHEFEITIKIKVDRSQVSSDAIIQPIKDAVEGLGSGEMVKVTGIRAAKIMKWQVTNPKSHIELYNWTGTLVSARRKKFRLQFDDERIEEFHEDELTFVS